ncbi:MAG: ABC transporter substrate-binding protein [Clostridium sp.]|nr:ABC transporter substrate-binding protein [Clostridium sp.]
MKKKLTLILAICMVLSFTACSSDKKNTADGEKKEITIVLDWTPNTNHTGLYVADALGYFDEAGLNVTIIQPPENGATDLVASGGAQFGIDFQEYLAPVFGTDNQLPVIAVAAILQHNTSGIVSLREKGIDSPVKLEGMRYATWEIPIEQAIIEDSVTKNGGDFSKVALIPAYVDDIVAALNTDIDCVWIYYGWDGVKLALENIDTNFLYIKDMYSAFDFYSPVIIANTDYLESNPDEAKAFLDAVKKGYEYAAKNPEEAADILLKAVPELDSSLVHASQEYLSSQYIADAESWGFIDQTRWDAFYQWVNDNGLVEKEIEAGAGFTNDYLSGK